ncbi:MAG: sulfatase [Verrucomicrobiota bacterium]
MKATERPNIVFIMADDHAPHALSCYGSRINRTPNLDRLAKEGMRFTHCFDTVSLCAPSRASLLTSKYCHKHGFIKNEGPPFDGAQQTVPKLMQQAGYRTGIVGKWHLGSQPTGFDYYDVIPGHGKFWDCPFKTTGDPWQNGDKGGQIQKGYLTDIITERSINWLNCQKNTHPFFLMVHHKAPHQPYHYPDRYRNLYSGDLPLPDTFWDTWDSRDALADTPGRWSKLENITDYDLQGDELGDCPIPDRSDIRRFRQWAYQTLFKGYLRLVASLDDSVEHILKALEEKGILDNTLVIYTSDNGYFLGDHGLFNKMWMYEESLGLPLLARLPGRIQAGTICHEITSILDFAPTFLNLAGSDIPHGFQGRDLTPLLESGPVDDWRDMHYYHYYQQFDVPSHCGIRTKRHKLIEFYTQKDESRWELFDLEKDPHEVNNLAKDPKHLDLLETMQKRLRHAQVFYEDPVLTHQTQPNN